MNRLPKPFQSRSRMVTLMVTVLSGFAAATLVAVAVAKTFTVQVAKKASVTNQSGTTDRENILVTSRGFAVYTLSGDSMHHPKCTKANGCFKFWPPVTVSSARKTSKAPGIKGKLGVWHRNGFFQVTLAGHPLYRFGADSGRDHAAGEGIRGFGGTWHVFKTGSSGGSSTPTMPTKTTTSTTTTSSSCLYPGYC